VPSVYNTVFGGNPVAPAYPTYLALSFSTNQILGWPLESNITSPAVAEWIDCTATAPSLTLQLSDARQVSTGYTAIFNNVGTNTFSVLDAQGNTLLSVASGQAWILVLSDNTTLQGTWRVVQLGAGVSSANAAALAGNGLKAISTLLNERIFINAQGASYVIQATDRAACIEWTGGSGGVFTGPTPSVVGSDWFCYIKNSGTGVLTLSAATGTIDGTASKSFNPNDSCIVVSDGINLFTMGFGQSVASSFNFVTISLAGASGTVVLTGAQLNRISYKFTGALAGATVVQVPASIQQYWVDNETTGAFTLTISAGGGSTVVVQQGTRNILYCDGLNIVNAVSTGTGSTVLIADGTAASPGLAFASDTQLGLYKVGTDILGIATAGVARVSVNASGDVVVNAPSTGIALSVTGASATAIASFIGTDVATVQVNSSASTNRAIIVFEQASTAIGRVGIDGSNTLLSDSANGDVCITSTGDSIRFGQQAGATQVSISSAGVVTLAAATGMTLVVNAGSTGVVQLNSNHTSGLGVRFNDTNGAPQSFDIGLGVGSGAATLVIYDRTNTTARLVLNNSGNFVINAPASGSAFTVTGVAGSAALTAVGSATSGQSLGVAVAAGTTPADSALLILNQAQTQTYFQVRGDGIVRAVDDGGTLQIVGWRGTPINTQSSNYVLALSDRGKAVVLNGSTGQTVTVNNGVFSAGDVVTIIASNSTNTYTIVQGTGMSLFWAGNGVTSGNRTLSSIGVATIVFQLGNVGIITGSGLS
jgi:hypothetical protein